MEPYKAWAPSICLYISFQKNKIIFCNLFCALFSLYPHREGVCWVNKCIYASSFLLPTLVIYYTWMHHHSFGHSSVAADIDAVLLIVVCNYIFAMLFT